MTGPIPEILRGDARQLPLPDASVDLIVCSPPYFGLRSYTDGGEHYDGQIGAEPTPREFIAALVECTRDWMRVLKPSGSIFVNLGDKYGGSGGGPVGGDTLKGRGVRNGTPNTSHLGRPKSLMLLPERYRIACVDELGLIARAVIVWSKPNGLPESVQDRVRRSHEDWVHLTRSPKYFAAIDEIRESYSARVQERQKYAGRDDVARRSWSADSGRHDGNGERGILGFGHGGANPLGKLPGSVWEIATQPLRVPAELGIQHFAAFPMALVRPIILGWSPREVCTACGEGRRPVVAATGLDMSRPQARRAAELARAAGLTDAHLDALKAVGLSDVPGYTKATQHGWAPNRDEVLRLAGEARAALGGYAREYVALKPTAFRDACACPDTTAPSTPGVVLDPFGGTGTTALVAAMHGRRGISVDLSADYCRLAQWRANDPKERARAAGLDPDAVAQVRPQLPGQIDLFGEAS